MVEQGQKSTLKQRFRGFFVRFIITLAILFIAMMLFFYYGVYSDGSRAGKVIKVSRKGVVFKTFEGQLNLGSFGAIKNEDNQLTEIFDFSIEPGDKDIYKELQEASLTGERVNLHYVERYVKLPWRGDTKYFIKKVERSGLPDEGDNRNFPRRE